jgi:GTP pyrophosphokinase
MVPLETALKNGQTIEIIAVKDGGPSRDWISPDKNYIGSSRARQRVRAWFNALDDAEVSSVAKVSESKTEVSVDAKVISPEIVFLRHSSRKAGQGGDVLVVGVDSLC